MSTNVNSDTGEVSISDTCQADSSISRYMGLLVVTAHAVAVS